MSEVRIVKFNLKTFSQDYVISFESRDDSLRETLEFEFSSFYSTSSDSIKEGIKKFFSKCPLVSDHQCLQGFLLKEGLHFSM